MDNRSKKLLFDVVSAGRSITEWCRGRSYGEYEEDRQLRRAVEREFEVIGEALHRLANGDAGHAEFAGARREEGMPAVGRAPQGDGADARRARGGERVPDEGGVQLGRVRRSQQGHEPRLHLPRDRRLGEHRDLHGARGTRGRFHSARRGARDRRRGSRRAAAAT